MTDEPTILVKKADGSFVRMPLSQVRKTTPQPPPPKGGGTIVPSLRLSASGGGEGQGVGSRTPPPNPLLRKEGENTKPKRAPYPTAPMPGLKRDTPPPNPLLRKEGEKAKVNDFRSPLEESAPTSKGAASKISESRSSQVDEVAKKINFPVPPNFTNRLRSIVQLCLKDVRSSEETKQILLRSIKDGGMGFTENQAEKVVGACEELNTPPPSPLLRKEGGISPSLRGRGEGWGLSQHHPPAPSSERRGDDTTPNPLLETSSGQVLRKEGGSQPASKQKAEELLTALMSPEEKPIEIISKKAAPQPQPIKQGIAAPAPILKQTTPVSPLPPLPTPSSGRRGDTALKLGNAPLKPSMRDISAPPVEMGPVDEVKYIGLTDFRRLSQNVTEAGARLKQKFFNLREESYLLYLDALTGWKQSPLYLEYIQMVCYSLANRKTLAQAVAEKNGIKLEEIKAIVGMEREL